VRPSRLPLSVTLPLVAIGLLWIGSAPAAPDTDTTAPARRPATLGELETLLAALPGEVDSLLTQARRHPSWRVVDTYLGYSDQEFAGKRDVEAEDVADLMWDESLPRELRVAARDALANERIRNVDPDLSLRSRKRKVFSTQELVPHLDDAQLLSRELASELLITLWGNQNDPDIQRYDPRSTVKKNWTDAIRAWRDVLRRG
jgi:hypothetical protein